MNRKEVRFEIPLLLNNSCRSDTNRGGVLREVKELHRKNRDISKAISERIENRAEEILRYVKKIKNELLDECYTITKQNDANLSSVEKCAQSKFDGKSGEDMSTIIQEFIFRNADMSTQSNRRSCTYISPPQIDIIKFKSGFVDILALKAMFGALSVQCTERGEQRGDGDENCEFQKENIKFEGHLCNENIQSSHDTPLLSTLSPMVNTTVDERINGIKSRPGNFSCMDRKGENVLSIGDSIGHRKNIYGKVKEKKKQKHRDYFQLWPEKTKETTRLLNASQTQPLHSSRCHAISPVTTFTEYSEGKTDSNSGLQIYPILQLAIDCEVKPICCLCVVGSETCWAHQGFSTTNYLLNITARKRKKVQFGFVVEDWSVIPPDTVIAVDYNNRIAKLTPFGPDDTPLTAMQNIGWTFHHVDLHPIGVACCGNGDILVSFVDEMTYNVNSKSRRKVVRMNNQFEVISNIEYYGGQQLFTLPRRLAENTNGDICIVDEISEKRGQVLIFHRDESLGLVYSGIDSGDNLFNPNGICCNSLSRIIISDYTGNKMHVLDHTGKLLQYIVHPEIKGSFCVAVDCTDRIWIGLKCGRIVVFGLEERHLEAIALTSCQS